MHWDYCYSYTVIVEMVVNGCIVVDPSWVDDHDFIMHYFKLRFDNLHALNKSMTLMDLEVFIKSKEHKFWRFEKWILMRCK